jgi:hypothetical protein
MTTERRKLTHHESADRPASAQVAATAIDAPAAPVARRRGAAVLARLRGYLLHPSAFWIALLALIVVGPLLQPGYFWGAHDARHDVYFLFEYDKSVLQGNWFPRWGPDWAFGYGYPFWIIYAPLAVFVEELFHHFLSFGWEDSVKAMFALSFLLSGLGMYGFVRSWLGRRAGLVAAVAYMVIPYHLLDAYVRAAIPESVALALLPFVLWGFRETVMRPRTAAILGAALAYAALLWTHNLTAVVFTPGLALYLLVLLVWRVGDGDSPQKTDGSGFIVRLLRSAAAPALAVTLAVGLSAAFLFPALLESRNVNQVQWFGQYYNPFQHFVYFFQLLNPAWGFGISFPGPVEAAQGGMSYQLGAVPVLLALIALATMRRLAPARRRELWVLAAWGAAAVCLTLGISAPAWHLPLVPYAQFPWRYLMLAAPILAVLAGAVVAVEGETDAPAKAAADRTRITPLRDRLDWPTALLVALLLLGSYPYFKVEMRQPTPEQGPVSYAALMAFQRSSNEMTGVTAWVDPAKIPTWSPMADQWAAGNDVKTRVDYSQVKQDARLAVNSESMGSDYEQVWYHAGDDRQSIPFQRFWYPGWKAYLLDGKNGRPVQELPVTREDGPLARIRVPVPAGEHFMLLRFEDTPLRFVSKLISYASTAVTILGLLFYAWRQRRIAAR